jgi:biotin carboxylase
VETVFVQREGVRTPALEPLADDWHVAAFEDEEKLVALAEKLHGTEPFDCVLSFTELGLVPAALIAQRLGLPGASAVATSRLLRDKATMRQRLNDAGLSPVPACSCAEAADAMVAAARIGLPVIMKPRYGTASAGIHKARTPEDVEAAAQQLAGASRSGFVVEQYLEGPELSVEAFSFHGRHCLVALTAKSVSANYVELGHIVPAEVGERDRDAVVELVSAFLDLVGVVEGPSHTEVKLTGSGPRIVESHDRLGGDHIFRLVQLAYEVDLVSWCYRWPLDLMGVPPAVTQRRAACIRFVVAKPGRVVAAGFPGRLREGALDQWELEVSVGDEVKPLSGSWDRAGYVIATGTNPASAAEAAERLAAGVLVETVPIEGSRPGSAGGNGAVETAGAPRGAVLKRKSGPIVVVGYSQLLFSQLDGLLPAGSVIVVEESDIIERRSLERCASSVACIADVIAAPYQQDLGCVGVVEGALGGAAPGAVVPGIEYGVLASAVLAERWGLPGASVRAARSLTDKLRLREVTAAAGLRNPRWAQVTGPEDVRRFAGGGPVVLKPANRQASLGVELLADCDGVEEVWERTVAACDSLLATSLRPLSCRFMAEELVRGHEYSAEALVRDGTIIFSNVTGKTTAPGRHPVEIGHVVPADLAGGARSALLGAMHQLVEAVGFRTGVLHAEWMLDGGAPVLIECAGRVPGDKIVDLIDMAYGCNLAGAVVSLLRGLKVVIGQEPGQASAVRFVTATPGRVTAVDGVDEARRMCGVRSASALVQVDDVVLELRSSWDRVGEVLAVGSSPAEALGRSVAGASRIRVTTMPASGNDVAGVAGMGGP